MAIQHIPIDIQPLVTLLQTALTAPLDRNINICLFTSILVPRPFILVFQQGHKAWLKGNLPKVAWSQDQIGIRV
jgi:hypothetical protein